MNASPDSERIHVSLTQGARAGLIAAVLPLIAAAYLFWSPIQLAPLSGGFPVKCGTAAFPPGNELVRAACGDANVIRQWQAASFLVAALTVALGALYIFGVRRRTSTAVAEGTGTGTGTASDASTEVPTETAVSSTD